MDDYAEVKDLFDRIREASNEPLWVESLEGKYFSPNDSDWEFSHPTDATIDVMKLYRTLKDPEKSDADLERLADLLNNLLFERGYRDDIFTHQEHRLMGSSGSGTTDKGHEFPYTVCGILAGNMKVKETRRARDLVKYSSGIGKYWGLQSFVTVLLPPIDDQGNTIGEPKVVDTNDNVIADTLVAEAPYKRT